MNTQTVTTHETLIRTAAREAATRYQPGDRWPKQACIRHYTKEAVGEMDAKELAILEDEIRALCPPPAESPRRVMRTRRGAD